MLRAALPLSPTESAVEDVRATKCEDRGVPVILEDALIETSNIGFCFLFDT